MQKFGFVAFAAAAASAAAVDVTVNPVDTPSSRVSFFRSKTETWTHPTLGITVHSDTYDSLPMELGPGEMVFTNVDDTPMQMPKTGLTGYAILAMGGEIVEAHTNRSAPLSEVYDHHWIAVHETHNNPFCGGSPNYVVGIGAESRNTKDIFPEGYGYVVKPFQNHWGANIHLLHTEGLAGDDEFQAAKECNECYYADTKGKECTKDMNGTFQCCGQDCPANQCFCPTKSTVDRAQKKAYALRYQVNYTYQVSKITPMNVGTLTAPDCQLFYAVYENDKKPEHVTRTTWTAPADFEAVYAVGHQHVGALNISLLVNNKTVCTSYPTYGTTPDKAGDEYGYVVAISTCIDKDTTGSVKVKKGDEVTVESWYWVGSNDTRIYPHPGGTHLNVMAYMYIGFTSDSPLTPSPSPSSPPIALPKLNKIQTHTFSSAYSCNGSYDVSGLRLPASDTSRQPLVLFNGACGSTTYFEGLDMATVLAEVGPAKEFPLEQVTANFALNSGLNFSSDARVTSKESTTYVALVTEDPQRASGGATRTLLAFETSGDCTDASKPCDFRYAVLAFDVQVTVKQSAKYNPSAPNTVPSHPPSTKNLPVLNTILKHSFSSAYSCGGSYDNSSLYLMDGTSGPDLLFDGACLSQTDFEAMMAGEDFGLVAELGPSGQFPLENVSALKAFNYKNQVGFESIFVDSPVGKPKTTYAVLRTASPTTSDLFGAVRALFAVETSDGCGDPAKECDIRYAVLDYSTLRSTHQSPGFNWSAPNV